MTWLESHSEIFPHLITPFTPCLSLLPTINPADDPLNGGGGGGGPSCRRSWCTGPRKFILLIHPTPSGETGRKEQRDVMFRCCCPYTPKMIISDESLNLSVSFPCFFPFAYKEGHVDNRLDQNLFCSITPTVRPIPHPYITN